MTLRTSARAGLGAAVLAGLALLTACGGGGGTDDAQVASLGGASGATSTTAPDSSGDGTTSEADAQQAMLDFARCMRENGIDMPDPEFSADGKATIGITGRAGALDEEKMQAAQEACQSYMDKVRSNMPPPDPAEKEKMKQQMLAFAQCMRDHGIDMPDPEFNTDGGGGVMVRQGGVDIDPDSPGFQEASEACSTEVGMDAMPGRRVTAGAGSDSGKSSGADT